MNNKRFVLLAQMINLVFIGSIAAQAGDSVPVKKMKPEPPWWVERFGVSAGLFVPISNTRVEVGNKDGTFGTAIDLEDDLGFNQSTIAFLGGLEWRASRRSKFELNYFQLNRKSTHTLEKDIEFKDTTYHTNTSLGVTTKGAIFQFSYSYAIFLNPRYEAGVAGGVHIVGSKFGMSLASTVAGTINKETDFDFTAPLPDLGIWGGYAINKRWAVKGAFNYLALTIGDYRGRVLSYNAGVMYGILKNLNASLVYAGLNIKVDVTKDHFNGDFKWGYNGPALTANYTFGKNKWRQ